MPSFNRSAARNAYIYDAENRETVLGGLVINNGVTNANFYSMAEILFIFESSFSLQDGIGNLVQRDHQSLQPGNYYILAASSFAANNEPWLLRTISLSTGTRLESFRNAVRERDRRCVITGRVAINADIGDWSGLEAAHIFPLAYEGHWREYSYDRWITILPASGSNINSVQNGLLLRSDMHIHFDNYLVSINPDDNYKIVCFARDGDDIAGSHVDQKLLENAARPVDQLLRWHFRQAVLANMRGAGEPIFEHDFPAGSDMVGEVLRGPNAGKRMEFELFSRLKAH